MSISASVFSNPLSMALFRALQAAASLVVAHLLGVGYIMYMDLTDRWAPYALCKKRPAKTVSNYIPGLQSLVFDLAFLFVPCLTVCLWYQSEAIVFDTMPTKVSDMVQAAIKCVSGYVLGKVWAFAIHYLLHHPKLYRYHKKHHQKPAELVASAAWEDSAIEYAIMELPSFCLTLFAFPTYWFVHLAHFALHGIDGASGHSGFKAPGIMGYIFDGEYHYYHHAHLTVNYAELEILDKLFGTHHSQDARFVAKKAA